MHVLFPCFVLLTTGLLSRSLSTTVSRSILSPSFWSLKCPLSAAADREDFSNGYPISDRYRETFDSIVSRWRVAPMHAFDESEQFVKAHNLEVTLRGSLVLVEFELKHYAIRDKRSNGISTNTFSATATQVRVLERGSINPSPYKSMLMKGPKPLPRSPRKREDQINAVKAFHPSKLSFDSV
jgi:hypothetical protein